MNVLLLSVLVFLLVLRGISSRSNESLLVEELMREYGPASTRPVRVQEEICHVSMRYIIANVISLDEPNQIMTVSGWLKYAWVDEYLQWDANETNVDSIRVATHQIWHPDITLYNNVDSKSEPSKSDLLATVSSDGSVTWSSPAIFVSSCILDVRYFPFDTQICELEFGSWSYEGHEVQLGLMGGEEAQQTEFAENGIWSLEDVEVNVQTRIASGTYNYSTIKMYLRLRRRYEFYLSNIMLPCVLLSFMSTLVYLLPPDCGEKISYGMTLVLSLLVFQQFIAESLPPVADGSPILGLYFTFVITMGCLAMVVTSVVLNIYCGRDVKPPPRWMEILLLEKLGPYIGRYRKRKQYLSIPDNHTNGIENAFETQTTSFKDSKSADCKKTLETKGNVDSAHDAHNYNSTVHDNDFDSMYNKWQHISVVVDRLLLICSMTIVLSAAAIIILMIYLQ
ncbi:neuronal acetylcholine receptor subunit alpha-9-like [Antedon mediterranea]|uniref:neuronal acetylcholine receptor subunit alpha-9-like n=1 Tax=Antedon mediterranea TaxID=105859 RepID=UPI003AF721FA